MKNFRDIVLSTITFISLLIFGGCGESENMKMMDRVDNIIESAPDSALQMLESINVGSIAPRKEKARYALLKSMAYDKNYIDTISFEVIQPAIDYYLKKGTPDEKLRTLYYQGRIFQNRHEDEEAMKCFIKATELKNEITDSNVLLRTFIAQGVLYDKQGLYESYVRTALNAYEISHLQQKTEWEMDCLTSAINGNIWLGKKEMADSLFRIADSLSNSLIKPNNHYLHSKIIYAVDFLNTKKSLELLDSIAKNPQSESILLDLAHGYERKGNNDKAIANLSKVTNINEENILKYLLIKSRIYENMKRYQESLAILKVFIHKRDSINSEIYSQELISVEKRYNLEKNVSEEKLKKRITLLSGLCLAFLLLISLVYAIKCLKTIRYKNITLNEEKKLLENDRSQIMLRLSDKTQLSESLHSILGERLKILNGLLASQITSNEKYAKEYRQLNDDLYNNKDKFLKTLRENFTAINPDFMSYLKERALTEVELDYVCLYALGLRGKEIGTYLGTKRHYTISSDIRKKLGLDSKDTNLGVYIQSQIAGRDKKI